VSLRQLQNDDAGVVHQVCNPRTLDLPAANHTPQAYSLAAHKFWILADDDVPRMEPGYRCDLSVLGNECVDCVEYVS
jgi:hypothetical protein